MSVTKPLSIYIEITPNGRLVIRNSLLRKSVKMDHAQARLANLMVKYRQLGREEMRVEETGTHFEVSLPLFRSTTPHKAP